MKVSLAVLADYANITQEGKLNIMGVFTDLNPPVLPFALPTMYLVVIFQASPIEANQTKAVRLVLVDGEGKELFAMEQGITIPHPRHAGSSIDLQTILCLNMVRFERADSYAFHILVGGEPKAEIPLRVNELVKEEMT